MNGNTPEVAGAKRLLGALAEINRLLRNHAVELRRSSAVKNVQARLEAVSYEGGPILEGYVDAELTNGDSFCWCVDVRWTRDSWVIEATLDKKSGDRQETVKELPPVTATDLEGFLESLDRTVHELLSLNIKEFGTASRR